MLKVRARRRAIPKVNPVRYTDRPAGKSAARISYGISMELTVSLSVELPRVATLRHVIRID